MKLSKRTLEILSNFATINNHLQINSGSEFYTRQNTSADSPVVVGNIMAIARVEEDFPWDLTFYDLKTFLQYVSLPSEQPEIEPSNKRIFIKTDGFKVSMPFAEKEHLIIKEDAFSFDDDKCGVKIKFKESDLTTLQKAANIGTKSDSIALFTRDGDLFASVFNNATKESGDNVEIKMEGELLDGVEDFYIEFNLDQFVMIAQDYEVSIYEKYRGGELSVIYAYWASEFVDYVMPSRNGGNGFVKRG